MKSIKQQFSKKSTIIILIILLLSAGYIIFSANPVTKPHEFTAGQTIYASHINENFDILYARINELEELVSGGPDNPDPTPGPDSTDEPGSTYEPVPTYAPFPDSNSLPIGTILMYDGNGWQDNVTLPGWYICTSGNAAHGCPNLANRFIMGSGTPGQIGGNNSQSLTIENMPVHTHSINHNHAAITVGGGSHSHNVATTIPTAQSWNSTGPPPNPGSGFLYTAGNITGSFSASGTAAASSHSHTVNLPDYTGISGSRGSGSSFDNRPAYYTVIYIRRCY